ncbi:peptidylprolyl isomerase [Oceanihabitans sediminis]|uniref:peptidylprolyl isomerase n=1 Tax=Oceanihabitans sediminis TaxID=1812012 RepID=UPI0009303AB4|nr:peptidylprolyl isomerase [Oceanihabitans sediminis]MDX1277425.1 peptidylprolyl isomerase [Oceanihabitans sediminis]
MQLKTNNLKSINKLKHLFILSIAVLISSTITAQEIIEDEVKEEVKAISVTDSVNSSHAIKVDGVAAVVGEHIILDSDIDKTILQMKAQGVSTEDIPRCQIFGSLLENKLYAHHAVQDSIEVSEAEIRSNVDYQIQQFLAQTGGDMQKLLDFYKKEDEKSFREEMYQINKNNELAKRMQSKIIDEIEVTPEEVRVFFNAIPKDERPTFGTELKVSQIVIEPKVSSEEIEKVINRLKEFKADVLENGASFRSKVVLYTDDKASVAKGGLYTLHREKPLMVKEFRDVAFSLQEGEISDPFETDFGYHIIQLEKIRGQEYDVRHILLIPNVSSAAIQEAKEKLEGIREQLIKEEITFEEAARKYSDEKETRSEGGFLINPATQDYNFELTKMDTELYTQIQSLKDDEISLVLKDQDRTGKIKFKILRVTDRVNEHEADYSRDYLKIKELALTEKRFKAIGEWQNQKIMDTYIKINADHRDCDFSSNWLKK